MKNKILSIVLGLAMLLSFTPAIASEDIPRYYNGTQYDEYLYYMIKDDNTVRISDCVETATEIVIPDEINGMPVTELGVCAFEWCGSLESVTIPDSVTVISDSAFKGCYRLKSVIIPDSVTEIVSWAFLYSGITSITIPANVTAIGREVFNGCKYLTEINVEEDNPNYSSVDGVLFNKDKTVLIQYALGNPAEEYAIPDGVASIGNTAFKECDELTNVIIPDSVTSIGEEAFRECNGLTNITIPDSVTSISREAFRACGSLESVTLPNGITDISPDTFYYCESLKSAIIPDSVKNIGAGAFSWCTSLENVTIPEGVTTIGYGAFSDCISLTSVTIPNSVTGIEGYVFAYCNNLTKAVIPENVMGINKKLFIGCDNLKTILIPRKVTIIEEEAFSECDSLTDVYYTGSEEDWAKVTIFSENECLINATIHYNSGGIDPIPTETPEPDDSYPYVIDGLLLKTINGEILDEIPTGTGFIVNTTFTKTQNRNEIDYIFVAVYDTNGALLGLDYIQADFADDYTYNVGFYIPPQTEEIGSIKAFIWNTFNGMTPLAESKTL